MKEDIPKNRKEKSILGSLSSGRPVKTQANIREKMPSDDDTSIMTHNPILMRQAMGKDGSPRKRGRSVSMGGTRYIPHELMSSEGLEDIVASPEEIPDALPRRVDPETPKERKETLARSVAELEQSMLAKRGEIDRFEEGARTGLRLRGRAALGEETPEGKLLRAEEEYRVLEAQKQRATAITERMLVSVANDNYVDTTNLLYFKHPEIAKKLETKIKELPADAQDAYEATTRPASASKSEKARRNLFGMFAATLFATSIPASEAVTRTDSSLNAGALVQKSSLNQSGVPRSPQPNEQHLRNVEQGSHTPAGLFVQLREQLARTHGDSTKSPNGVTALILKTDNPERLLRALHFVTKDGYVVTTARDTFTVDGYGNLVFDSNGKREILLSSTKTKGGQGYRVERVHHTFVAPQYAVTRQTVSHRTEGVVTRDNPRHQEMAHEIAATNPHKAHFDGSPAYQEMLTQYDAGTRHWSSDTKRILVPNSRVTPPLANPEVPRSLELSEKAPANNVALFYEGSWHEGGTFSEQWVAARAYVREHPGSTAYVARKVENPDGTREVQIAQFTSNKEGELGPVTWSTAHDMPQTPPMNNK